MALSCSAGTTGIGRNENLRSESEASAPSIIILPPILSGLKGLSTVPLPLSLNTSGIDIFSSRILSRLAVPLTSVENVRRPIGASMAFISGNAVAISDGEIAPFPLIYSGMSGSEEIFPFPIRASNLSIDRSVDILNFSADMLVESMLKTPSARSDSPLRSTAVNLRNGTRMSVP